MVTGGSRGIGKCVVQALAENGAAVAVASRNLRGCEDVVRKLGTCTNNRKHAAIECDVSNPESVKLAMKQARDEMVSLFYLDFSPK